ncbi:hypothetical protein PCK1_000332 [Pneumocystis canis]|nr:hypothetical protein PCK1_000332 [Pneumocystis canis]
MMISFEESIEHQKENIEPLRQGRSVKSLVKAFSEDPCSLRIKNEQERCIFESEIDESDELDDPLDIWVKYIKWTNAFPFFLLLQEKLNRKSFSSSPSSSLLNSFFFKSRQTPKVDKQEKSKKPCGRAYKRMLYNRRFVNVTAITTSGGKRKMNVTSKS